MDVASMFRNVQQTFTGAPASTAAPATGQPAPGTQGQQPPKTGLEQTNPGADPANQNLDSANLGGGTNTKGPGSEMDPFKDVFKIDPNKQPPKDPLAEPLLTIDPTKIQEAVSKMDFMRGVNPDLVTKALQGDAQSFAQVLNQAVRNSYFSSFQALTGIVEKAVKTNNDRFNSVLGDRFRNFQINTATSSNPVLSHPAVQPVLASLRQLIASQKPDAHPNQVQKEAEDYFLSMGKALNSLTTDVDADGKKNADGTSKPTDWFETMGVKFTS